MPFHIVYDRAMGGNYVGQLQYPEGSGKDPTKLYHGLNCALWTTRSSELAMASGQVQNRGNVLLYTDAVFVLLLVHSFWSSQKGR